MFKGCIKIIRSKKNETAEYNQETIAYIYSINKKNIVEVINKIFNAELKNPYSWNKDKKLDFIKIKGSF